MSIKYDKVQIRVSELQTQNVVVAPWETQVLQAMYGEDAQVTGSQKVDKEVPDPRDEFARLANRYGPKNADTPTVAAVYGSFGPGVKALAEAIEKATGAPEALDVEILEKAAEAIVPELSDEQIDVIMAEGDKAQAEILGEDGGEDEDVDSLVA